MNRMWDDFTALMWMFAWRQRLKLKRIAEICDEEHAIISMKLWGPK